VLRGPIKKGKIVSGGSGVSLKKNYLFPGEEASLRGRSRRKPEGFEGGGGDWTVPNSQADNLKMKTWGGKNHQGRTANGGESVVGRRALNACLP